MNNEEIVKALEHCLNGDYKTKCNGCHYDKSKGYCQDLDRDVLDLVKRLQKENEDLQKENKRLKKFELHRIEKIKEQNAEIERLTKDKSFATRKMMESKAKAVELQKQVEQLTEERDKAKRDNTGLFYNVSRVEKENAELQNQVDKYKEKWQTSYTNELNLQKQVDELKEKQVIECHGMFKGCDMVEQAVKDTAKEILQTIMDIIKKSDCFLSQEVVRILAKNSGVEVEE